MLGLQQANKVPVANIVAVGLDTINANSAGMMMTQEHKAKSTKPQMQTIESRFGAVAVDVSKAILFPVGLLGMPQMHHFVLTEFPNQKLKQFKLLQSLDDHALSFITLPVEAHNAIIDYTDVEAACEDMEIALGELGLLLVVSVHRNMNNVQLSVNARAPIFIASNKQAAAQYVFTTNRYKVQHFITENNNH